MRVLIFIGFFIFLNCKQQKVQTQPQQKKDLTAIKKDVLNIRYTDYLLDRKAQNTLENWRPYFKTQTQIEALKKGDFSFLEEEDLFKISINDLKNTLPIEINQPAIEARIVALENALLKLKSSYSLELDDAISINTQQVLQAFSYLNLQINKKFEKDDQQIEKPE